MRKVGKRRGDSGTTGDILKFRTRGIWDSEEDHEDPPRAKHAEPAERGTPTTFSPIDSVDSALSELPTRNGLQATDAKRRARPDIKTAKQCAQDDAVDDGDAGKRHRPKAQKKSGTTMPPPPPENRRDQDAAPKLLQTRSTRSSGRSSADLFKHLQGEDAIKTAPNGATLRTIVGGQGLKGDGIEIKSSKLRLGGAGLFLCDRPAKAGELITTYDGKLVSKDEAKKLDKDSLTHARSIRNSSVGLVVLGFQASADGIPQIPDGRIAGGGSFANHWPARKNAEFFDDAKKPHVMLRAVKDIAVGEEVFLDYGSDFWSRLEVTPSYEVLD
jgi:hypothetical protein